MALGPVILIEIIFYVVYNACKQIDKNDKPL